MKAISIRIDDKEYWANAISGKVVSKELIIDRHPSMSNSRESIFIVESSGKEHSIEMEVLTSAFRQGSNISLIYLSNRENRPGKLGLVYNHDTEEMTGDSDQLRLIRRRFSRPLILLAASLSCAAWIYFGSGDPSIFTALFAIASIPVSAAIIFVLYMNSSYFTSWLERKRVKAFVNNEELRSWVAREKEKIIAHHGHLEVKEKMV